MRYQAILSGLVLTLAVAGRAPMVQAAADCADLLDNNSYLCQLTGQDGVSFPLCVHFNTESPVIGDFDVEFQEMPALGCSCETKNAEKFKQSKSFLCAAAVADDGSFAVAIEGKVKTNGKRIEKGQIVFDDGFSAIFSCKLEPACGL
jgi:hypothetical protein